MIRSIFAAGSAGLLVCACAAHEPMTAPPPSHDEATSQPHFDVQPAAIAVIELRVARFGDWKAVFDAHADARRAAGILAAHVNQAEGDPEAVTVCLAATSFDVLQTFLDSPERARAMQRAGVIGTPTTALLSPVEDRTVKERPLAGAFVRHRVADFDAWKRGFDARAAVREGAGVVGWAVDRAKDDPNQVLVYLQAETPEALRRFTESDDLRAAMAKSGVEGAPRIALVQSFAVGR